MIQVATTVAVADLAMKGVPVVFLSGSLIVARGCLAFHPSCWIIHCHSPIAIAKAPPPTPQNPLFQQSSRRLTEDPTTNEYDDTSINENTLRSKLDILQGVVRELHHKNIRQKETLATVRQQHQEQLDQLQLEHQNELQTSQTNATSQQQILESEHQNLLQELQRVQVQLESMTDTCKRQVQELESLQRELTNQKQTHTQRLQQVKEEYKQQFTEREEALQQQLQTRLKEEQKRHDEAMAFLQAQYEETLQSEQQQQQEEEEQMQIATAAVHAAEQRAAQVTDELGQWKRRYQKRQLFLQLQRLVIQGLLAEQQQQQQEQ